MLQEMVCVLFAVVCFCLFYVLFYFVVAVDKSGNTIVVGMFDSVVKIGKVTLSTGFPAAFIAKMSPTGEPLWALQVNKHETKRGGERESEREKFNNNEFKII